MLNASQVRTAGSSALAVQWIAPDETDNYSLLTIVHRLSQWGIQILPAIYGKKQTSFKWTPFQNTRMQWHLYPDDMRFMFAGNTNLVTITGRVSAGRGKSLVVIDFDDSDLFRRAVQASYANFGQVFAVNSSRGGHLWFFVSDGEIVNSSTNASDEKRIHNVDILGRNKFAVLPPSAKIDENGKKHHYTFHDATDETEPPPLASIAELQNALGHLLIQQNGKPYEIRRYSKTRRTAQGDTDRTTLAEYRRTARTTQSDNRNNVTANYMKVLLRQGHDKYEAANEVRLAMVQTKLSISEIDKTINSIIKSYKPAKQSKQSATWKHALAYWHDAQWQGRTASRDKAVFQALVDRCKVDANSEGIFIASVRQIADKADISRGSAGRALQHMQDSNLIIRQNRSTEHAEYQDASEWVFSDIVAKWDTNALKGLIGEGYSVPQNNKLDDILGTLRNTLGHIAIAIYEYLCSQSESCRASTIAREIGHNRSTVSKYLKSDNQLVDSGLVHKDGYFYSAPQLDMMRLEGIAADTGAYEVQAERAKRFNNERQVRLMQVIYKSRLQYEYKAMQLSGKDLPKISEYRKRHTGRHEKVIEFSKAPISAIPAHSGTVTNITDSQYELEHDIPDIEGQEIYEQDALQEANYYYIESLNEGQTS